MNRASLLVGGGFTPVALRAPLGVAVTALLADRLARVREARAALGRPDRLDALHDFRVAVRRLRALVRAYRPLLGEAVPYQVRRGLRRLTRTTNAARDLEVKRAWLATQRPVLAPRELPGLEWIEARVARAEQHARAAARAALRDLPRLLANMNRLRAGARTAVLPPLAAGTFCALAPLRQALARRLDRIGSVDDQAQAHRARIAGKRVRYLLEPFVDTLPEARPAVEALKQFQDVVGDMHDAHVAVALLSAAIGAARRDRRQGPVVLPGLRHLERVALERRARAWRVLQRRWLRPGSGRLLALLTGAEQALVAAAAGSRGRAEVERKYLLRGLPPRLRRRTWHLIEQGYLPGTLIDERLRRTRGTHGIVCTRTVKLGAGPRRDEYEERISEPLFRALWPLTAGRRVRKRRYRVSADGLVWEIDRFLHRDLVLAEVELPTATYEPPIPPWLAPWIEREVTGEPAYLNLNLAE